MKRGTIAKVFALVPLALLLSQCDQVKAVIKPRPAKPDPYAFDIIIRMSPKSEAAMKVSPGFAVEAYYYGDALPAYQGEADDQNRIRLGDERWNCDANTRRVHMDGKSIDTSALAKTRDGVRVFLSGDITSGDPGYVLSCRSYTGTVRQAQKTPPTIDCEYDAERYWEDTAASSAEASGADSHLPKA